MKEQTRMERLQQKLDSTLTFNLKINVFHYSHYSSISIAKLYKVRILTGNLTLAFSVNAIERIPSTRNESLNADRKGSFPFKTTEMLAPSNGSTTSSKYGQQQISTGSNTVEYRSNIDCDSERICVDYMYTRARFVYHVVAAFFNGSKQPFITALHFAVSVHKVIEHFTIATTEHYIEPRQRTFPSIIKPHLV